MLVDSTRRLLLLLSRVLPLNPAGAPPKPKSSIQNVQDEYDTESERLVATLVVLYLFFTCTCEQILVAKRTFCWIKNACMLKELFWLAFTLIV